MPLSRQGDVLRVEEENLVASQLLGLIRLPGSEILISSRKGKTSFLWDSVRWRNARGTIDERVLMVLQRKATAQDALMLELKAKP